MMGKGIDSPDGVILAVRLGWLTVETFGRLRHYVGLASGRKPERPSSDASKRFDFSSRSLSEYNALLLAMDQLVHTANRLDPELPPAPLPARGDLDSVDLHALQGVMGDWSTQVWVALSTKDDIIGRGFTYGGSLADTYWHAAILGPRGFGELLRPHRLEYMAHRFDGIAEYLPPYTARVLHHTLYRWRGAYEYSNGLDVADRKRLLKRLESQAGVWHYLLFGGRSAESYLTVGDRRLINWIATGITTLFVVAAMLLVWLLVLALSSAGRVAAASLVSDPQELSEAQAALVSDLLDWQKWSALLATLSSVVLLITGLITRLSGWGVASHGLVKDWLKLRRIYRRAYRDWRV